MRVRRARWVQPVAFLALAVLAVGCASSEANGGKEAEGSVVARVGDTVITSAELDKEVSKRDAKAFQAYYDAKKRVLDQMINQRLIDAELERRGIEENELRTQVMGGVAPVTDEDVRAFYDQNQAQMGGRTYEQVAAQITNHLTNLRRQTVMNDFFADLKKKTGVEILIEPPRTEVKIAANDPRKGPEGAPITLVEFSDFQ
ncbi:MAG: hypothetical protein GTN89_04895 [Acidobacteria bacterium]|nr:hypothetical protein [Acidobacteriota bacterium]NIM60691.1 hypothetical protein [Acidobacteriota bacterium]NIO58651.1 hypothetical protein [Acidobacteriota bacterium]NIQ29707.1 hypothetical protein [Acidobacteriota bacterium]NIQ84424.1 hypothetical protein [Acidobacteriota bacterium]